MCENRRILHHLKNNIENPHNTIIVIGFMAKNTLGRNIVEKKEIVRIFGRPYDLKAEVVQINAFSAQADKYGLEEYARSCRDNLKGIFLVHGEVEQIETLRKRLYSALNIKPRVPAKEETFYLKQ